MISFICCSINPDALAALRRNLEETIDVPFELLGFDNRATGYGLCKVYNHCAAEARYDLLCFLHEDVAFRTRDFLKGGGISALLRTPQCGVIGFAGSTLKLREMTGLDTGRSYKRGHYIQRYPSGRRSTRIHNPKHEDFSPVVLLDGLCMFVSRKVWEEVRFDEVNFPSFHGYDLDFTLAVSAAGYTNYVCHTVMPEHFSIGSFNESWLDMLRTLHDKWCDRLPMNVGPTISAERIKVLNIRARLVFTRILMTKGLLGKVGGFSRIRRCIAEKPLSIKAWMLLPAYLKYRWRYPHQS